MLGDLNDKFLGKSQPFDSGHWWQRHHPEDIEGTSQEQKTIAAMTAEALLPLMMLDNELIITHGNGPVVGKILMRQMLTRDTIADATRYLCCP